jgi:hypothetical protein
MSGGTEYRTEFEPGMTLRDYFAAQASDDDVACAREDLGRAIYAGDKAEFVLAHDRFRACRTGVERNTVARYYVADCMLKARDS